MGPIWVLYGHAHMGLPYIWAPYINVCWGVGYTNLLCSPGITSTFPQWKLALGHLISIKQHLLIYALKPIRIDQPRLQLTVLRKEITVHFCPQCGYGYYLSTITTIFVNEQIEAKLNKCNSFFDGCCGGGGGC